MKRLCVLGITGSIGKNVVRLVNNNPNDFIIVGCAFNSNIDAFEKIYQTNPSIEFVSVTDEKCAKDLKKRYPNLVVFEKEESIVSLIDATEYDMVVNSLVGFAGLVPTVHTIEKGIDIALANKESLVVGGDLINAMLKESKSHLYPIDSEHVALAKCLNKKSVDDVESLIITASGGSFRNLTRDELEDVTVEKALNHPSWNMGAKITIDSATMLNKGFEIIEAYHLFHFPLEKIKVLLHDESMIHSLILMKDHSIVADLGPADMIVPISYALYEQSYHELDDTDYLRLDEVGALHFRKFDAKRYPGVELARKALLIGGTMPCVLNAANEAANLAFRQGKIKFNKIEEIIEKTMNNHSVISNPNLEDLIKTNKWAYDYAEEIMKGM